MNETISTILKRGSLRKYNEKDISKEDLDLILKSSMRAPTAGNMMCYSVIIIKDKETKEKLSVSCDNQPFIKSAPILLVFLADFNKWYKYYEINDTKFDANPDNLESDPMECTITILDGAIIIPPTGDYTNIIIFAAMLILMLALGSGIVLYRKKKLQQ